MSQKTIIAVLFGGRSVEHDVSILTGLQFIEALDPSRFEGLPVYIDPKGQWWTGGALLKRSSYPLRDSAELVPLALDLASQTALGQPSFTAQKKNLLGKKTERIPFDCAVIALHGSNGEDGTLQGVLDFANIPFTGCGVLAASRTMDKLSAKRTARANGVPVLPEAVICRPPSGTFLDEQDLKTVLTEQLGQDPYPVIVKPRYLGSSVGVSRADDFDSLMAALLAVFRLDGAALIEPCVTPLVEYNIAVRRTEDGAVLTSAIEKPLGAEADVLDFAKKYRAGGKGGAKQGGHSSEGMASLNRELSPASLTQQQETAIRSYAAVLSDRLDLAGSCRIDFLSSAKTGEVWFNEVNTIPGSFAFFLWEAADPAISFLDLTTALIEEAQARHALRQTATDAGSGKAVLFQDKG